MSACAKCCYDPDAQVAAAFLFLVEREALSLNAHVSNDKFGHRYRRERDTWCWLLRAARSAGRVRIGDTKRRVTLTRVYGPRKRDLDRDNLAGGMKCIVDALVRERLLVDDTGKWAEIHYAQRKAGKGAPSGVHFEIEVLA